MILYLWFLNYPIQVTWYTASQPDNVTPVIATGIQVIHAIHAFCLFLLYINNMDNLVTLDRPVIARF